LLLCIFSGFGLPLAVITSWPSSLVVSGCVFSIFFPLFIVSGNQAQVVTCDKQIEFRIFHPTVVISNAILTKTFHRNENRQINRQN
jgi:etoposide-induced 2.4 mRNA